MKINKESKISTLTYDTRDGKGDSSPELHLELISDDKLILWVHEAGFIFHMIANVENLFQPDRFPVVYLHFDSKGKTKSSIGLLVRSSAEVDIIPKRLSADTNEIASDIRELLYYFNPIVLDTNAVSNKQLDIQLPRGEYFSILSNYIGKWFIYYHERYSGEHIKLNKNPWIGAIARATLNIKKDRNSGELICEMESYKFPKHEGIIEYKQFENKSYINLLLYNKEKTRTLSFIFNKGPEIKIKKRLHGVYSIIYAEEPSLGCGTAIMVECKDENDFIPQTIDPHKVLHGKESVSQDIRRIINSLSFRNKNSILLSQGDFKIDRTQFRFSGTYRMYSYGRKLNNDKKCVTVSYLKLFDTGYVKFKGKGDKFYADGYALENSGNLFVTLKNPVTSRIGYCIFNIGQQLPGKGIFYTGIFNGITIGQNLPIGNRIVLEYCEEEYEKLEGTKINLFSEEYFYINEGIRKSLTGRIKNFIGFLREKNTITNTHQLIKNLKREIDFGHVFFQNACYDLSKNSINENEITKELIRAIEHGFSDKKRYQFEFMQQKNYSKIKNIPEVKYAEELLELV